MSDFTEALDRANTFDLKPVDGAAFLAQNLPPFDWIIPDFMAMNFQCALYGKSKSQKSFFAIQLGLSVACGVRFLGFPAPERPRRVAYFNLELLPTGFQERMKAQADAFGVKPENEFFSLYNLRGRAHLLRDAFTDADGNPLHDADAEFEVEPHTVLSAKDLCSLPFVDKLMAAGIASFKIEGRARNANYVKTVTEAYREAVDAVADGTFTQELAARLVEKTKTVFHREFSTGLYFGRPGADQFTDAEDSTATTVKRHVGVVMDYFLKAGIAQVKIQDCPVRVGDKLQIHGPTTGVQEFAVASLRRDDEIPAVAEKGTWVTFPAPRCRVGDKVFLIQAAGAKPGDSGQSRRRRQ